MMFILLIAFVLILLYFVIEWNLYGYWKRRGVPGPKPDFLVGNIGSTIKFKKSIGEVVADLYNKYQGCAMVGFYRLLSPTLIVRDPELIRDVMVKNFANFHNNELYFDKDIEPIFGRNPFILRDEAWKFTRSQITSCFTTGKMKMMYPLIDDSCKRFIEYVEKQARASNKNGVNAKEVCTKFTLNNVASCAFGLDSKCYSEEYSEFQNIADNFLNPGTFSMIKLALLSCLPFIEKFIKFKVISKCVDDKLINIVSETVKYRKENNVVRNDFLDFVRNLKDPDKNCELPIIDIVGHAGTFLLDGYETSSIVISFLLYELAVNQDAQEILRREINQTCPGKEISFDEVHSMPYLDAVFHENLRLHPVLQFMGKKCVQDFVYEAKDGDGVSKPKVVIEKDTSVLIPVQGLHMDSKYFKCPRQFKPERFLPENRDTIPKYTFLPFGEGPRICLGQKFGVMQVKAGAAYLIKNFKITLHPKTKTPLKLDPKSFLPAPIGGLWLNFEKIH